MLFHSRKSDSHSAPNSIQWLCVCSARPSYSAYRKVKHCRINVEGRLYVVGELLFESLVSLVNYYTRNPLYRNVKLVFPISKDVLKTMAKKYGNGGPLVSVAPHSILG